jgi:hypothetical protein
MSAERQAQHYTYVNRPYERVAEALRLDAIGIFQRATASATTQARALVSTMRANIGSLEIGTEVVIEVKGVEETRTRPMGPTTRLHLAWRASKHPDLFPTMDGTLAVFALSPEQTQVAFTGTYCPPLGAVGAAFDALIGHRVAEAAVQRFVEEVAEGLRVDVPCEA